MPEPMSKKDEAIEAATDALLGLAEANGRIAELQAAGLPVKPLAERRAECRRGAEAAVDGYERATPCVNCEHPRGKHGGVTPGGPGPCFAEVCDCEGYIARVEPDEGEGMTPSIARLLQEWCDLDLGSEVIDRHRLHDESKALIGHLAATPDVEGAEARLRRAESFIAWVCSLDSPTSTAVEERRCVTLTQIIERARAALGSTPEETE